MHAILWLYRHKEGTTVEMVEGALVIIGLVLFILALKAFILWMCTK